HMRCLATIRFGLALVFVASAATDKAKEADPNALLRQIRSRAAVHLSQLLNYTCREVVDRRLGRDGKLNYLDTVEIEVALIRGEELFSMPGEDHFGERSIDELPAGTISNAALGAQIDRMFASSVAEFRFVEKGEEDGHKTYRYDLRVPLTKSMFIVKH